MITSVSKKGVEKELIYYGEASLLDEFDTIKFHIKNPRLPTELICEFTFDNDGVELTSEGTIKNDGNLLHFIMHLHKWKSDYLIEPKDVFGIGLQDGKGPNVFFKYGTVSPKERNTRTFNLSVWVEWN